MLADPYDDHNELVGLVISDPAGGAVLGSVTTATLTIQDIDPNNTVPTVTAVQWTGTSRSITSLVISFNEPLAAGTADNPANYARGGCGQEGQLQYGPRSELAVRDPVVQPIDLCSDLGAESAAGDQSVLQLVSQGYPGWNHQRWRHRACRRGADQPGTNFTALFAQGTNLKYTDAGGNQVSFGVKDGGYLEDLLTGSGQGQRLVLVGAVPHRTVVTGSVKQGKKGSGRAYLGYSFYGLGAFGDVRVLLKSPPFEIQRYPFSPGLPIGPPTPLARLSDVAPVEASLTMHSNANAKIISRTHAPVLDAVAATPVRIGVPHPKRQAPGDLIGPILARRLR